MRRALLTTSLVAGAAVVAPGVAASAPDDDEPLSEMTLEELLDVEVEVPSFDPAPARRSPGIVTVMTRDELHALGARDLVDVLRLVPGLYFAVDVQGVVGLGMRGVWGHEGKILLLIDGVPWNETQFGTVTYGNRFSLAHIDSIEVIRGAGSAVHGGYAELGVINVVTRGRAGHDALRVELGYGQLATGRGNAGVLDRYARRTLAISGGKAIGGGARLWGRAELGEGQRSDGTYADFTGDSYDLTGNSDLDPMTGALGLTWRGLDAQLIAERYRTTYRDGFDAVLDGPAPVHMAFDAIALAAAYRARASERVVVTPWLRAHYQQPWHTPDEADGSPDYFQTTGTRGTAGVAVSTEVSRRVQLHAGAEGYVEYSEVGAGAPDVQLFPGGATEITHEGASAYVEADLRTAWVDVTAGGRAEAHSDYGATAVPRIAATTSVDRAHAKLLVAQGYRTPSIQNLRIEPAIEPERMTNLELEAGYRFGDHVSAILDVFDGTLRNPIVYGFDGEGMFETYANYTQTGSRGVELDLRTRGERGFATLAYSFFTAAGKNEVDLYAVPGSRARLLAAPRHKLTLHGAIAAGPRVVIGGALVVLGPRHAVVGQDAGMAPVYGVIDTDAVLDATVQVRDVGLAGLDVSLGLHDALDARPLLLQPYASGHAPYPGPGREVLLRVSYERP